MQRIVDNYTPPEPFYYVSFLGTNPPSSVTAAGAALPDVGSPNALAASGANAFYYNAGIKQTFVKVFDTSADITLEALF